MWNLTEVLGAEPRLEVLDNGLTSCLLELPGSRLVSTVLLYRAGTLREPAGQGGVAHFLEHMMFKGSPRYPPGDVDRLTLELGGDNNAFTSHDCTVYHFSFARDRWEEALAIESDRMRELLLDAEEVATEAGVILEEVALHDEDPWSSLEQQVRTRSHAGEGYGRPVLGRPESVAAVGPGELGEFHRLHYGPDNALLVLAGDLGDGAREKVRASFGGLERRGASASGGSDGDRPRRAGRIELRRGDVARLLVSAPSPEATSPDHVPLRLLAALLGTGRSSRLSRLLVDELQLCSGIGCDVAETVGRGSWNLDAEVLPGVAPEEVEARVFEELARLGREPVTQAELDRVKAVVGADWVFSHERILDRALTLGLCIGQFGPEYLPRVASRLSECDPPRLLEAARHYLSPDADWVVGWSLPEGG